MEEEQDMSLMPNSLGIYRTGMGNMLLTHLLTMEDAVDTARRERN